MQELQEKKTRFKAKGRLRDDKRWRFGKRDVSGAKTCVRRAEKNFRDEIIEYADTLGIDPAIISGILSVETCGSAKGSRKGLFMINFFRAKYLRKKLGHKQGPGPGEDGHDPTKWRAWNNELERIASKYPWFKQRMKSFYSTAFRQAKKLDEDLAYRCTSFGNYQIHGWNYRITGFESPKAMGKALTSKNEEEAAAANRKAFINFLLNKRRSIGGKKISVLIEAAKLKDWWGLNYHYNGKTDGGYGQYLQAAYNASSLRKGPEDTQLIARYKGEYKKLKGKWFAMENPPQMAWRYGGGTRAVASAKPAPVPTKQAQKKTLWIGSTADARATPDDNTLVLLVPGSTFKFWNGVLTGKGADSEQKKLASQIAQFAPNEVKITSLGAEDITVDNCHDGLKSDNTHAYFIRYVIPTLIIDPRVDKVASIREFGGPKKIAQDKICGNYSTDEVLNIFNAAYAAAAQKTGVRYVNHLGTITEHYKRIAEQFFLGDFDKYLTRQDQALEKLRSLIAEVKKEK
jgi:hypothetical protein